MAVESTGNQCKPGIFLLWTCAQVKTLHSQGELHFSSLSWWSYACIAAWAKSVRAAALTWPSFKPSLVFLLCSHWSQLRMFKKAALIWASCFVYCLGLPWPPTLLQVQGTQDQDLSKCPGALGALCYQGTCWLVFLSVPSSTEGTVSWLIEVVAPLHWLHFKHFWLLGSAVIQTCCVTSVSNASR